MPTLGPPGDPPKGPSRKRDEKIGSWVLPGIAKQAFCRNGMVVLEVCVFFCVFCDVAKLPFCAHRTRLFDENVGSWVLPGGSQFQQNPRKIEKKSLGGARWKALCARCCTRGASGPPPTMKTMVSFTRNHRFHISTCTSNTTENDVQGLPLCYPFGWFCKPSGTIWADTIS